MIWPFNKNDTNLDQATSTLSPFISMTLMWLDLSSLHKSGRTRMLAECYIYGAIRYLTSYDDMNKTSTGVLLHNMFAKHFDANDHEVKKCLKFCYEVKEGGKEKMFMMEGAGAIRNWLVNNDRDNNDQAVARNLKNLLEMTD